MKQELRQIYGDLSIGKLSQKEALERIKALKLKERDAGTEAVSAMPVWQRSSVEAAAGGRLEYTEHQVIACELPAVSARKLESLLPNYHCFSLRTPEQKNIAERYSEYAVTCFERIQAALRSRPQGGILVQIVVPSHGEQTLFAGLSGLLKTAAAENPLVAGQLLLMAPEITSEELAGRLKEEKAGALDAVVRYEQGTRQVLRWQEVVAEADNPPVAFNDHGVYLITGGLGGLGLLFAKEILEQTGQARVVLTGRSALSAEKQALLDRLSPQAGRVSYRQMDLGNLNEVRQLIGEIRNEYGQLNGILHSAGMVADNFILKKTSAEFLEMLAPKVMGTYHLDEASQDRKLDFFVLFSSIAGVLGNPGQAGYATANGFMDWFAAYRNSQVAVQQRHGRTRSINWGFWQAGGMGADAASLELLQKSTGMRAMQTGTGLRGFYRSLALPYDRMLIAEGNAKQLKRALATGRAVPAQSWVEHPMAMVEEIDSGGLVEKTQEYLRRQLSGVLKLPSHKIDPQATLEKYGIDSILATELTNQLEQTFGPLSRTLFFEYQTISELTGYFVQSHSARLVTLFAKTSYGNGRAKSADMRPETPAHGQARPKLGRRFTRPQNAGSIPPAESDVIAIIGLSGRYPEAVNLDAYWRNLCEGKDCITEVPKERWDWREYFSDDRTKSGHHFSKWGGFIAGVDEFDPLFFNISPKEAKYIDPQERLFLQHAWMAIEDAGYTRAGLQVPDEQDLPGQVGVYVGLMYSEYQLFGAESGVRGKRMGISGSFAGIANRVSYVLNLHGPSMTLDTMCSSSLSAMHLACQDLKQGRTSMAIAGGVNVSIHPNKYLMLSAGQFISGNGHCQSFGKGGDGYIPGEGVGVVLLKRLSDAKRDGDHIYGIIRGSALNHSGKTNGYTVPKPQAQSSAISRALSESHTDARHISYIEAHGTGTKLGDPIEITALNKAFRRYTEDTEFCLIGSAKSNIGHCESAAGVAGLTKVLLQMQYRQIVPSLHSAQLNPNIDFPASPFVVNQTLRSWDPPVIEGRRVPRIAGISSFGAGGSNAHVIVEEYQAPAPAPMALENVVILLSARTAEQLRQKACDLLEFVRARMSEVDLPAMAYTLQTGREAMDERLGLIVSSAEQLAEKLQAWVSGEQSIEDAHQGQVKRNKEALSLFNTDADLRQTIDKWIVHKRVSKLLELWVKGLDVDWSRLYGEARPGRVSLPTYPFARERYWIETADERVTAQGTADAVLHPLLHSNTSDLNEQRYSSTFTGAEFFLVDQQLSASGHAKQKVLPAVAYLEMAQAAIRHAVPARPESAVLELRNVVWAQPVAVTGRQISIALLPSDHDQIDFEIYSEQGEQEIVHCQGRAVRSHEAAPARLDLGQIRGQMDQGLLNPESIYAAYARMGLVYGPSLQGITAVHRGSGRLLAQLRLPKVVEETSGSYVLHPSLMESALQACIGLMEGESEDSDRPRLPFALEQLRIIASCAREMIAWVRYAPGGPADNARIDIDLCDERGNVSVQMRGVGLRQASPVTVEPAVDADWLESRTVPVAHKKIPSAQPQRREIELRPHQQMALTPIAPKKRTGITLSDRRATAAGGQLSSVKTAERPRAYINLSSMTSGAPVPQSGSPAVSSVKLFDDGNGIFSIQIAASVCGNTPARETIGDLLQALDRVQQEPSLKVLILSGIERYFSRGAREDCNEAQGLYGALVSFPFPVIAALQGDAIGAGLLAASLCDFMVCNEDATYGYTDAQTHLYPTTAEAILFSELLGAVQAQDLLYVSGASTGRILHAKGWTSPMMPGAQVERYAQQLASTLATKSQEALRLLKQHLNRRLIGLVREWMCVEVAAPETENPGEIIISPANHIQVDAPLESVLVIKFRGAGRKVETKDLVADLGLIFTRVRQAGGCKAIVLASEYPDFLPETEPAMAADAVAAFQRLVMESEIPVVAALNGNAKGAAWLMGLLCDACVYSQTGVYSFATMANSPALLQTTATLFPHRLGHSASQRILLTGAAYSGADLQHMAEALLAAEHDQVLPAALKVAEFWTKLPRTILAAWKKHTATSLQEKIRTLPVVTGREEKDAALQQPAATAVAIALHSKVVTATAHPEGIVVVKMEDRHSKNMFTDAFFGGLSEAFVHIERTPGYKVVVLTGYDHYFASGGTKESLLAVQEGRAKFTDFKIFQAALDCKLPVIAAMQGHGIGVGWTLGMFADIVLMSEGSRYVSPYMNYGFTPGGGATYILAEKLGPDLARESLLTGQAYTGRELKQRGLRLSVLPRGEVVASAMALARQIAQSSLGRVIGLKQQLTAYLHPALEETYRLELAMHEKTLVGQSDALAKIQENFYQEIETSAVREVEESPQQADVRPAGPSADSDGLADVTASLTTLLAAELQMQESDVDESVQFVDLGLDSISGVSWIRRINEKHRLSIDAAKIYNYPTLSQLSRYVKAEAEKHRTLSVTVVPAGREMPPASAHRPTQDKNRHSEIAAQPEAEMLVSRRHRAASRFVPGVPAAAVAPANIPAGIFANQAIAVIGMAGQFPQAKNLEEFWQNIAQGRNCISPIPPERWDVNAWYQPGEPVASKTNSPWVGALEEYDRFDPLFFNISPTEAESMDPQHRLFLQACWHSIENAGYDARVLSGSRCGVFVGCVPGHYQQLSRRHQLSAQGFTGNATSILAARISYFLNLQGPCISIDTACSSSLVAIANACDSLALGGSDLALAGGVYVMVGPDLHIMSSQAGMLSPEGRCFTFDQRADGFVPGEGVGVVLLKRLADAQKDNDIIYGVIEGWGVNQDGRTNGITAPNPESQTRLEQEVYDKYRIDPAGIQLIEAHGTGTKLGDPIEVEGLKQAFRKYTQNKEYCALGSVKSNIGHCATAAGVAGFIKAVLALKNRQLPPTINFDRLNEHIDLSDSPFYVNSRLQEWKPEDSQRRRAAISAFGFSGTNAHIVLGEYLPPAEVKPSAFTFPQNTQTVIVLSARTAVQLRQKVCDLRDFIRNAASLNLVETAYTLQVGREAMEERVGFLVDSVGQLTEKLEAYIEGRPGCKDFHQGAKRSRENMSLLSQDDEVKEAIVSKWIGQKKLSKLLDLWSKGLDLDWSRLYSEVKPQRINLPVYPFAKERYWIDASAGGQLGAQPTALAVIHPLLHRNTSELSEQRYSSTFTGQEFFLADYHTQAQRVLSGAGYLEMARAAIRQAVPAQPESSVLELHNTIWAQPFVVGDNREISIALSANDDDRIDYEIYSRDGEQEIIHCKGRAVWSGQVSPAMLDLEQLREQMSQTATHRGRSQLLAQLWLPKAIEGTAGDYVLHPLLMESALQACAGLIDGESESFDRPRMPSALETLRIVSTCGPEMFAWVRYAPGSQAGGKVARLDIDLCDESGKVCVQMRGFSLRAPGLEIIATADQTQAIGCLHATPVWQTSGVEASVGNIEYSEHCVILCNLSQVDTGKLESLLPHSRGLSLKEGKRKKIALCYSEYALACFERIQTILNGKPRGKVLVQIVVADHREQVLLAGLSGLLRTAALENPWLIGQMILVPSAITTEELTERLQEEKKIGGQEVLVRYEHDVRQILRWQYVAAGPEKLANAFRDDGIYLITGGLGGLGVLFAKEILAQTRQARVVLTGRSAFSAEIQARLDGLSAEAGRLIYRQVDLCNPDQARQLIIAIQDEYGKLNGILHSAGMIADNFIPKKTGAQFSEVLAPKVTGTYNLDQAGQDVELDFFVLFSSMAGALGNPGQIDYAAANGFMDWFAAWRNAQVAAKQRHGRTRSINWPLWQAGGMGIDVATREMMQQTTGMKAMRTATGMNAFYLSLALPCDQLMVMEGIQTRITAWLQKTRILEPPSGVETTAPRPYANPAAEAAISLEQLQQQLKGILATVLRIDAAIIDADRSFSEFGLDSFLGVEMVVAVNKKYGTEISNIRVFDYPTVREFSLFLEEEIKNLPGYSTRPPAVPAVKSPVPAAASYPVLTNRRRVGRSSTGSCAHSDDKIAIIGMSGRYPKANNLQEYWNNLLEGRNSIAEVPPSRWDVNRYYDPDRAAKDKTNSKWLGALDDIDCFDPLFFRISPQEAEFMDPQQRLFLQESYRAFEDAGYSANSLSNRKCGVYLGVSTNEYMSLLSQHRVLSAPVTSNSNAIAAARIAYYLNLKGPAISVDTACSSSLVAIHLASQALLNHEIDMALAGGVSLWLRPESYVAMSQAGMFSPVGQCKTFDDTADGIVNGEGVGAVVLKRLKDAERDNDFICGVILGSSINQDGRTNGITAPSVNSQIELERSIYARHKIDPETIGYVETHGTGTRLGDPIELEALATVFKEKTSKKNFCALGAVKSNIGHTTSAAGVAGVQKVLLSMRHRTLVPSLNVTQENSRFDFKNSPFYISLEKQPWNAAPGTLRRAAVSSFGFSGTNAHLVIEEYPLSEELAAMNGEDAPCIVPLSARTPEQLWQRSRDLLEFIRTAQRPLDLAAVAYTLQIGRDVMEERAGFVVSSVDDLAGKLSAYVYGDKNIEDFHQGRVAAGNEQPASLGRDDEMREIVDRCLAHRKLLKLLDLWTGGLSFDWNRLYGDVKPRRISLPAYPFAREHYWIHVLTPGHDVAGSFEVSENMRSIEEIINRIGDEMMETEQAVKELKMLV